MQIEQNEITGAYYENDKLDWIDVTFFFFIICVVSLIALDLIFGAENVTNTLADLVVRVRN